MSMRNINFTREIFKFVRVSTLLVCLYLNTFFNKLPIARAISSRLGTSFLCSNPVNRSRGNHASQYKETKTPGVSWKRGVAKGVHQKNARTFFLPFSPEAFHSAFVRHSAVLRADIHENLHLHETHRVSLNLSNNLIHQSFLPHLLYVRTKIVQKTLLLLLLFIVAKHSGLYACSIRERFFSTTQRHRDVSTGK